jgi:hypothetical protein
MNITYGLLWQTFPLYYTGVLSSYRFDDYIDAKLGVVNGSNTDNNTSTGNSDFGSTASDGCAVLAALNVTAPGGNANWSNNFQYSSNSENETRLSQANNASPVANLNNDSGSGYTFIYNSWGNWAPKFANDKLLLAFNTVLGTANSTTRYFGGVTWYGAGTYAKYQFNDWFNLASRGEYRGGNNSGKWNANFDQPINNYDATQSWWEYTLTAGFNVIDNLLIRAEYRLDWGNNIVGTPGVSSSSGPAHYAGAEVVYSF